MLAPSRRIDAEQGPCRRQRLQQSTRSGKSQARAARAQNQVRPNDARELSDDLDQADHKAKRGVEAEAEAAVAIRAVVGVEVFHAMQQGMVPDVITYGTDLEDVPCNCYHLQCLLIIGLGDVPRNA